MGAHHRAATETVAYVLSGPVRIYFGNDFEEYLDASAGEFVFVPPRTPDVCDRCGGELYQRADDSEAAVMNRLDVYASQTAPLLAYYRGRGTLAEVRGEGAVADITAAIRKTVGDKVMR